MPVGKIPTQISRHFLHDATGAKIYLQIILPRVGTYIRVLRHIKADWGVSWLSASPWRSNFGLTNYGVSIFDFKYGICGGFCHKTRNSSAIEAMA